MLYGLLTVILVLVCILLVVVILLQSSKGGGLAGIAGGMSSTVFGGRSAANFLQRATTWLATAFLGLCLILAMMSGGVAERTSVTQQAVETQVETSPVPSIPGGATVNPTPTAPAQTPATTAPAEQTPAAGEQPAEQN